jgi:hypothetical protein
MNDEPQQLTVDGSLVPHSQVVREQAGDFSKPTPAPDGYPGTWMPVSGRFRVYPLELHELRTDDGVLWWSKGHQDEQDFLTAVAKATTYVPRAEVRHDWWATRQGWQLTGPGGMFRFLYQPVEPTARGAYPVTVVEL